MKRLAIIMSLYRNDRQKFVSLAVESVLNQTYKDFDFYIQYDGSVDTDVDAYLIGLKDERIKIQRRTENKGLAQSLNDLLSIVMSMDYKYIARMDADDINELNRFERQLEYFRQHPKVECLGTWVVEITSSGEEYYRKQMPETHDSCKELFRKRDCMVHPTVMFRRSYIEKAGFYSLDTYFGEDTMMWCQGFAANCTFANVPEYLYQFRIDDNFFKRRRGWKHATAIFKLRHKVNKILSYGIMADFWALVYAVAKMMPTSILNLIYKKARKV
ncbi:glycosyltransferase [Bacteroides sp. GM023]|uniref:glycosyltransferase n=1 Tax=Bacteroides sp. GM023 TaxID=2723058 RepID=UPI001CC295DB|nr:glycosyltransferase [Bacteroides sp. GM023]